VSGELRHHPRTPHPGVSPSFDIAIVKGTMEVLEFPRSPGPVFSISDDPALRREAEESLRKQSVDR
jgi:hypothetical protein